MKFTEEQLEKAKQAKNAEELLTYAKECGMELTKEQAEEYFAVLHMEGELSDAEINNVTGGLINTGINVHSERPPRATGIFRYEGSIHFVCPRCNGESFLYFMDPVGGKDPYDRLGCAKGHSYRWYKSDGAITLDISDSHL